MATALETTSTLTIESGNFVLLTQYSGEVNPNITFQVTITVVDGSANPIVGATVTIDSVGYVTDNNGQVINDFVRGYHEGTVEMEGYNDSSFDFTVLDENIEEEVIMTLIGSFDESFDESYES
jgi:hypothetical protein